MDIRACASRLLSLLVVLMLAGCAGGVSKETQQHFNNLLAVGDYRSAENLAIASGKIQPTEKPKILLGLCKPVQQPFMQKTQRLPSEF